MPEPWWGRVPLTEQRCALWSVGSVRLWAARFGPVLRVARAWGPVVEHAGVETGADLPGDAAEPIGEFHCAHPPDALELMPVQPDRPVVSRPAAPLYVPAGDAVTLYLETPVWLCLRLPEGARGRARELLEVPSVRLSDTWFGPSKRSGELAYASRLVAGIDPAAPLAPHVARSVLNYRNRTRTQLAVERIAVPAPALGIYAGTDGRLWSEALTVEQRAGDELALASVGTGAPVQAGPAHPLSRARARPAQGSFALRAVAALLRAEG